MKGFTLLIDGLDLNTGQYQYFPYTDKVITDFRGTIKAIGELKRGATSEKTAEYVYARYCVNAKDTNSRAIQAAYKAYEQFRVFPLSVRKRIVLDIHESMLRHREDLLEILEIEGHPRKLAEWETEGMLVGSSPETVDYYCTMIEQEAVTNAGEAVSWVRRPDGVICLSPPRSAAASNSFNGILVFLTGNSLIVKPPLRTPTSMLYLWKNIVNPVLQAHNAPPGLLSIVVGNSKEIMDEWLASPLVNDVILFTDSGKGLEEGARIYAAGKKPILELSGNDIQIVWKDADMKAAQESLLEGYMGSTQVCMVPKIALVHDEVFDEFERGFAAKVGALKVGLPSDKETILSPVSKMQEYFQFLQDALARGARIVCGGKRIDWTGRPDDKGVYLEPTLLAVDDFEQARDMLCIKEEIFFPLIPLIRVSGSDEEIFEKMAELVDDHNYGLRVSVWVSSPQFADRFSSAISNCGLLRMNVRHVGFSCRLSTHGGTRRSGGPLGEMNYFWLRTSHLQGICVATD